MLENAVGSAARLVGYAGGLTACRIEPHNETVVILHPPHAGQWRWEFRHAESADPPTTKATGDFINISARGCLPAGELPLAAVLLH